MKKFQEEMSKIKSRKKREMTQETNLKMEIITQNTLDQQWIWWIETRQRQIQLKRGNLERQREVARYKRASWIIRDRMLAVKQVVYYFDVIRL